MSILDKLRSKKIITALMALILAVIGVFISISPDTEVKITNYTVEHIAKDPEVIEEPK